MKKQLLIDCSFIRDVIRNTSLALYAGRLLLGFRKSEAFEVTVIVRKGYESYIDEIAGYEVPKIVIDGRHHVTPWLPVDKFLGFVPFNCELQERKIDVVLSPYYFDCKFFFPKKYHHYVVVHDLFLYEWMKERMGKYKYFVWRLYHSILNKKVSRFISISEKTRKELKQMEGIDSTVVYNSIPFDFSIKEEMVSEIKDRKYILDVNTLDKRKNTEALIHAFSQIRDEIPHMLYIKANRNFVEEYDRLMEIISNKNLAERVIIDCTFRSEGEMRCLYSHADLFVSPSLNEGFGWTPIEAAILKVPVLVSDIEVFREVTCNRIPLFNPHSPEKLAKKMVEVLNNPPSMEAREELAKFYLEKYSLKRQIDQLTEMLLRNSS